MKKILFTLSICLLAVTLVSAPVSAKQFTSYNNLAMSEKQADKEKKKATSKGKKHKNKGKKAKNKAQKDKRKVEQKHAQDSKR